KRVKNYFLDNGAWYLGEAFQFLPFRGSHTAKSVKVMEEYVISLGLPADLKPLEAGWRPPYWDDSIAMKALNIPLIEDMIDKTEAAQFHKMDINYFGEMINSRGWRWRLRQPDRVQRFLHGRPAWNGLHAMMYLPPDWEPPKEPPPSLQKLLDEERKREEERIRERAKLEAQNRPMHSYHVREMALLFKSVEDLELSIRAMNDLRNFGIVYFGDLISCPIERLARRNIGNKSIKEIQEALVSYDLKLFMDPKENPYLASFLCWRKAEEARLAKQDN
ncbi:MAG: hypothetical protein GWN16_10725, partial [Calditrichae bacterium]|nr:hypothetical protein [Candidatus Saccharibacteria bacterium]NIW79892.1 hypothetical protein [Calditrichia bacterium]